MQSSVQGLTKVAINTSADFIIAIIANYEIWQFFTVGGKNSGSKSILTQFRELDPKTRNQRIWQSIVLSGPVIMSVSFVLNGGMSDS